MPKQLMITAIKAICRNNLASFTVHDFYNHMAQSKSGINEILKRKKLKAGRLSLNKQPARK